MLMDVCVVYTACDLHPDHKHRQEQTAMLSDAEYKVSYMVVNRQQGNEILG